MSVSAKAAAGKQRRGNPALAPDLLTVATRGGSLPPTPVAARLGVCRLVAATGHESPDYTGHHHSGADWIFVGTLDGSGAVTAGKHQFAVHEGDVFLMPPGWRFHEATASPTHWHWLCVRVTLARQAGLAPLPARAPQPLVIRPGAAGFQTVRDLVEALYRRSPGFELEALGQLLAFLSVLHRTVRGAGAQALSPFVARACELMRARVRAGVSVPELARHCAMSESSFAHRFRTETGVTPMEWFRSERLRLARQLLLAGRSVKEVAAASGFENQFHFSRVFRCAEGLPPIRFQRLARVTARPIGPP